MKAGSKHLLWVVLLTILFGSTAYADTFIFDTIPGSEDLTGPAGSTVGLGYTVTNGSPDQWLLLLNINTENTDHSFSHGSGSGDVFNFPVVAPGSTITQPYDPGNLLGFFEFTWDPDAPAGFTNSGNFHVRAELWSDDPFGESPDAQFLGTIPDFIVPYSVTVSAAPCSCPAAVPEPSSILLLAFGLGTLMLFHRHIHLSRKIPTDSCRA